MINYSPLFQVSLSRGGGEDDHEGPGDHPEEEHGGAVGVRRDSPGNVDTLLGFL